MSPDPDDHIDELPPRRRWAAWLLVLPIGVVLAALAVWLWQRFDPFIMDRPDMKEANGLLGASRNRPLTDEEFERVIALLDAETPAAQLSAIATLQADVAREPARRDRALAALERCQQTARPPAGPAAGQAVNRLKAPPKGQ